MTKEVVISICGLQNGPETDGEPIETITTGEYFFKNGKHYILYEEIMEGETKPIKNRIKIAPGYMELSKSGMVSSHMLFVENQKNVSQYHTPYGSLRMGVDAKRVEIQELENEISVFAEYVLEMNEEFVADCEIKIKIKSKQ